MAYTAFHRRLNALINASPVAAAGSIIAAVEASRTALSATLEQSVGQINSGLDTVQTRTDNIMAAIGTIRFPELTLTEQVRDVLSGLAQIEVQTLDKDQSCATNNDILHKQASGRRMTERLKVLGGDTALAADYRAAFQPFATGNADERAARLQALAELRERVIRHIAVQQATI